MRKFEAFLGRGSYQRFISATTDFRSLNRPIGTPLPPPDRKTRTAPIPVPKRKPIPAYVYPARAYFSLFG